MHPSQGKDAWSVKEPDISSSREWKEGLVSREGKHPTEAEDYLKQANAIIRGMGTTVPAHGPATIYKGDSKESKDLWVTRMLCSDGTSHISTDRTMERHLQNR
uniref:Uncharacterized protein n=1 Tax=Cannabis sativa TaxID=3483 RepID=A0A803QCV4_CANSA